MGTIDEYKLKQYKKRSYMACASVFVVFLAFLAFSLLLIVDFDTIRYNEKFEEMYEHQLEYYENEGGEADDKYDPEELCNVVSVSVVPIGNYVTYGEETFSLTYLVTITNETGASLTDTCIKIPYKIRDDNKIYYFEKQLGIVPIGEQSVQIEAPYYIKAFNVAMIKTGDTSEYGVCYPPIARDGEISETQAIEFVDLEAIEAIIGEKPKQKSVADILNGLPLYIATIVLFIAFLKSLVNTLKGVNEVSRGNYAVINGNIVPKSDSEAIKLEKALSGEFSNQLDKKSYIHKAEKPMPSDFDDGHETTHDCGGFEINEDDYKIDPNDY